MLKIADLKANASDLIENQIRLINSSATPQLNLAEGMAYMAHGLTVFDDRELSYWLARITCATRARDQSLRYGLETQD
ncbi:MAG: hypothetical protein ABWY06_23520 [Pseudomonas sp.]|uniref:hypothetical protein n=1 Tax=Pseudomonas sp. TaxID=306 RepID=UPI0033930906